MTDLTGRQQAQDPEMESDNEAKGSRSAAKKTIITILLLAVIAAGAYLTFARIQWRDEADLRDQTALRDQIAKEHKQFFEEMCPYRKLRPR